MSTELLLRRLLEQPHLSGRANFVLALETGTDAASSEDVMTPQGSFRVCRASTELALRHELWRSGGKGVVAFVSDALARAMPADLLFSSRNQRVQVLTANEVLSAVIGAEVTGASDPLLEELAVAHLEQLRSLAERTFPSAVDAELLEELLLEACGESRVVSHPPAELLAAWIEQPPTWDEPLRKLIRRRLPRRGAAGEVLAWAVQDGSRLEAVVVHGAVLSAETPDAELSPAAWGPFAETESEIGLDRKDLRAELVALAEAAVGSLERAAAERLLKKADSHAIRHLPKAAPETSRLLRVGFSTRLDKLAKRLAAGEEVTSAAVERLASYRSATRTEVEVIKEMARLSRWLAEPSPESAGALVQIRHYQSHGAFADLAVRRLAAARAKTKLLQAEVRDLLVRCRKKRDAENRRFAATLASGYEKTLFAEGLHPLHRISSQLLRPGLEKNESFYLVVLDGCSYPVFLELLGELADDPDRPVGLQLAPGDTVARCLPSLAPLPSITSHARGAIFLGEVPRDKLIAETRYRRQDEPATDKRRFEQNQDLGQSERILFLKGDLTDGGSALFRALEIPSIDVVAAVFNAVDDQIGSVNTGAQVRVRLGQVTALKGSLDAALAAGRRVLLTADHGHTPFVDKSLRRPGKAPSRFVELGTDEGVPEDFLEIDLEGLGDFGGGGGRTAFAWRSGVYRGRQPHAGFHGGCSLEEMVVPLAWLVREGHQADLPAWWEGAGREGIAAALPEPSEEPAREEQVPEEASEKPVPEDALPEPSQIDLFGPQGHGLPEALWASLDADEKQVLDLLRRNSMARVSELASQVGRKVGRMSGMMSRLRRRLGPHSLFEREVLPDGEGLYRYLG